MPKEPEDWTDRWTQALTILGVAMLIVILGGCFVACMQIAHQITR